MESLNFFFSCYWENFSWIVWLILEIVGPNFSTIFPQHTFNTHLTLYSSRDQLEINSRHCHFAVLFLMPARVYHIFHGYFHRFNFFQCAVLKRREKRGWRRGEVEKKKKKNDALCNDKAATLRDYLRDEQVSETYTRWNEGALLDQITCVVFTCVRSSR